MLVGFPWNPQSIYSWRSISAQRRKQTRLKVGPCHPQRRSQAHVARKLFSRGRLSPPEAQSQGDTQGLMMTGHLHPSGASLPRALFRPGGTTLDPRHSQVTGLGGALCVCSGVLGPWPCGVRTFVRYLGAPSPALLEGCFFPPPLSFESIWASGVCCF